MRELAALQARPAAALTCTTACPRALAASDALGSSPSGAQCSPRGSARPRRWIQFELRCTGSHELSRVIERVKSQRAGRKVRLDVHRTCTGVGGAWGGTARRSVAALELVPSTPAAARHAKLSLPPNSPLLLLPRDCRCLQTQGFPSCPCKPIVFGWQDSCRFCCLLRCLSHTLRHFEHHLKTADGHGNRIRPHHHCCAGRQLLGSVPTLEPTLASESRCQPPAGNSFGRVTVPVQAHRHKGE